MSTEAASDEEEGGVVEEGDEREDVASLEDSTAQEHAAASVHQVDADAESVLPNQAGNVEEGIEALSEDLTAAGAQHASLSVSKIKAELRSRGVSEEEISACNEKTELVALLVAAGEPMSSAAAAGNEDTDAPNVLSVNLEEVKHLNPLNYHMSEGREATDIKTQIQKLRSYRRITPVSTDVLNSSKLWGSSHFNRRESHVTDNLLSAAGASQIVPTLIDLTGKGGNAGGVYAHAMAKAGLGYGAGVSREDLVQGCLATCHALDKAKIV